MFILQKANPGHQEDLFYEQLNKMISSRTLILIVSLMSAFVYPISRIIVFIFYGLMLITYLITSLDSVQDFNNEGFQQKRREDKMHF